MTLVSDPGFQDLLVTLVSKDRVFLQGSEHLLEAKDLKSAKKNGIGRWVAYQVALEYWNKYKEPVGRLLPVEVQHYIRDTGIDKHKAAEIIEYAKKAVKRPVKSAEAIHDRLLQFKKEASRQEVIEELVQLHAAGKLDDEAWRDAFERGLQMWEEDPYQTEDFFSKKAMEARIARRDAWGDERYPILFIDPLDALVRAIAREQVGLVMAPWKRGKSLMLIWIALAYCIQKYNVLYITLEDSKKDVDDRFDCAVTGLPIRKLATMKKAFRRKFNIFATVARGRLRVYDGSKEGLTVEQIEQVVDKHRREGFLVDAVCLDYDDYVIGPKKYQDKVAQQQAIYLKFHRLASKKQLFFWTAAQTRRGTEGVKIIGGGSLADCVDKIRKVDFAVALGNGDWGDESLYLWVAAHRHDKQLVGCNVMSNKERMIIYDREATMAAYRKKRRDEVV